MRSPFILAMAITAAACLAGTVRATTQLADGVLGAPGSYAGDLVVNPGANGRIMLDAETGTGANTAYLVTDYQRDGGYTYAFAYHFDGAKSAYDMLNALTTAGTLNVAMMDYGDATPLWFVDNIDYPGRSQTGRTWVDYANNNNPDNFWWFFQTGSTAPDGYLRWQDSSVGVSDMSLTNNSVIGATNISGIDPYIFAAVPVSATPEPASLGLLGLGLVAVLGRRR